MKGIIERAFEIARQGQCRTVDEIRKTLARECYSSVDAHLSGGSIKRQLKALIHSPRNQIPHPHLEPPKESKHE